jgi:2-dehydropantoate 2-reductase
VKNLTFSKIFILGAGAIGSAFGAALSRDHDVTLIGSKAHVEAVNSKGLSVSGDINGTFRLKADTEIQNMPEKTLVILTTKVQDSVRAIQGISNLLREDSVILVLQNGIGNEEIVKQAAGKEVKVLRGVLKVAAEFVEPGVIKFWSGRTTIGQGEAAEEVVEMLNKCSLDARLSENIGRDVWNKLVVNCVVNPLTAILRVTDGAIIVDSLKRVRTEIVRECIAVAEAEGIVLASDLAERIDRTVAGYANLSSMYQDIKKGKRTEIDYLNGKVIELGKKHGIPTPVNETLVGLIKFLEGEDGVSRKD